MKEVVIDWIKSFYSKSTEDGLIFDESAYQEHVVYWTLGLFVCLIISSVIIWFIARLILIQVVHRLVGKTKATWDDHLMKNRVFRGLALMVPLIFMEYFMSIVFYHYPDYLLYSTKLITSLLVIFLIIVVNRLFNAFRDIILEVEVYRDKPIQSYAQVLKIIFSGVLIIALLSVITDRSPVFFLTSLGAVSAVLLLIFKDSILGFVGSIQLSANDMIHIGDWVTMERFGADGNVEEINLTTVKVRNFDMTITTIPTYSFISDSFRNWRGMQESDGRRIKRSLKIAIDSVKFASPELIERLKLVRFLTPFIEQRQLEIDQFNKQFDLVDERIINKRRQTNIGLFRRYIEYYLKNHPGINAKMTLMVRQLEPTEYGIPLEIYCFTNTKEWEQYEEVMADIFDHLFAVIDTFDLIVFESPSGADIKELKT